MTAPDARSLTPGERPSSWLRRVRMPTLVLAAVAVGHGLFFWLVADAHFMPKVGGYSPPPSPPNFGARSVSTVDPVTGEQTTETIFVVSTQLATPIPAAPRPGK